MIKMVPYQICSKKGNSAINRMNRMNLTRFPLTHRRPLSPTGMKLPSSNTVSSGNAMSMWYPDSEATTHIIDSGKNL